MIQVDNERVNCIIVNGNPITQINVGDEMVYRQSIGELTLGFIDKLTLSQLDNMIAKQIV